jgi:hypothetical protein
MSINREFIKQNFIGRFVRENGGRDAVNEMSGSEHTFTPKKIKEGWLENEGTEQH